MQPDIKIAIKILTLQIIYQNHKMFMLKVDINFIEFCHKTRVMLKTRFGKFY